MKEGQAAVKKHRENETEDREKKRRSASRNGVSFPPLGFGSRVRPRVLPPPRWRRWRRQNLEKVLGDQDDLAASRDEDPAEDSTDISADMYAYLLNRLKGRSSS